MNETNKVILAAILGIIIGFGFGRFSNNAKVAEAPIGEEATEAQVDTTGVPAEPSVSVTPAPTAEVPVVTGPSIKISEEPIKIDVKPVSALKATNQTSKVSAVSAATQKAGKTVLAVATLDRQGWVAVHDYKNGVIGKILGAKHFGPATSSVEVPLMRSTVAGYAYVVMLHSDDGDFSDFTPSTDLPLLGANGKMIMAEFKTN